MKGNDQNNKVSCTVRLDVGDHLRSQYLYVSTGEVRVWLQTPPIVQRSGVIYRGLTHPPAQSI